jgi:hypothetical protein
MLKRLPVRRWQSRQWHIEIFNGSPSHLITREPQWHCAVRDGISFYSEEACIRDTEKDCQCPHGRALARGQMSLRKAVFVDLRRLCICRISVLVLGPRNSSSRGKLLAAGNSTLRQEPEPAPRAPAAAVSGRSDDACHAYWIDPPARELVATSGNANPNICTNESASDYADIKRWQRKAPAD